MVGVSLIDVHKLSYPPIWLLFEQGRVQVAARSHSLSALAVAVVAGKGPCDAGCAPASALTAAEASPVVVPPRVLDGFAGNGRRFRHGSLASVRFSAGVVHCRLRRPGEMSACCGVSGRFGLRNRPEVASGVCLR